MKYFYFSTIITLNKENLQKFKILRESAQNNVLIRFRKKRIEIELAEVEPLIQEARSAVGSIKSESLTEIRSLRAPPEIIRDILEGVLRLMGIQDTSWNSMKTFLAKRGVKDEIRYFSKILEELNHFINSQRYILRNTFLRYSSGTNLLLINCSMISDHLMPTAFNLQIGKPLKN